MASFGDQQYAADFRDLVTRIAKRVVTDERPEIRIGKVFSFNAQTNFAEILFAGETVEDGLSKVRVAQNMQPTTTMDLGYEQLGYDAPGDIVRVWGKPGSWFIMDFYSGVPSSNGPLSGGEPQILPGNTSQYWRGDKSWQALDKSTVGLSDVNNTSDVDKPISTAVQAALDVKTGILHVHDERYYLKSAVDTALAGKAPTVHGHALTDANITGILPMAQLSNTVFSTTHLPEISEVNGLVAALSGKAAAAHTHDRLVTVDTRAVETAPNDYNGIARWQFKSNSTIGLSGAGTYSFVYGFRAYADASGGAAHEYAYNEAGVWRRVGATTAWGAWIQVEKSGQPPVFVDDIRLSNARTPLTHTHTTAQVTGLDTALALLAPKAAPALTGAATLDGQALVKTNDARLSDARTPLTHTHTTAQVTGLDTALAGKAASVHTHTKANITDFAHTHPVADVTGLGNSATRNVGTTAGTVAAGDDARFTDARIPLTHTHTTAQVTGLDTALAGKAPTVHGHALTDANITGILPMAQLSNTVFSTTHLPEILEVNGLQAVLDTKTGILHVHDERYYTKTLSDDRFVNYGDTLMSTNPFGGKRLYINSVNNALFRAEARWTVTASRHLQSDDSLVATVTGDATKLFNGDYESTVSIPVGQYLKVSIDFNGNYPGYPYGYFFLSHYFQSYSASASMRVYCNYAPQGVGWKDLTFSTFYESAGSAQILRAYNSWYNITQAEFRINAPTSGSTPAGPTQIEWNLDRPGTNEMPFLDKYRPNALYSTLMFGSLTAPNAQIYSNGSAEFKTSVSVDGVALVKTADGRLSDARTPLTHTHTTAQVTGLDTALAGKAPTVHGHALTDANITGILPMAQLSNTVFSTTHLPEISEVNGLTGALSNKAGIVHTHTKANITDFAHTHPVGELTGLGGAAVLSVGTTAGTVAAGDDARLSDSRTPLAHMHPTAAITGLDTALGLLAPKAAPALTGAATLDGQALVKTNDARLADARTPLTHTHTTAQVTGLDTALALLAPKAAPALTGAATLDGQAIVKTNDARLADARTPVAHTHTTANVTGLDAALNLKAPLAAPALTGAATLDGQALVKTNDARLSDARTPVTHTHTTAQVTGLDTALAGKAATSHTHTTANITGLDTALALLAPKAAPALTGAATLDGQALVKTNDARLSDARTPVTHTHTTTQVTGLDTALAGKAPTVHGHALTDANITGVLPLAQAPTEMVRTDTAQTIAGAKTFSAPVLLTELATNPGAPASGLGQIYTKSDNLPYFMGDDGVERSMVTPPSDLNGNGDFEIWDTSYRDATATNIAFPQDWDAYWAGSAVTFTQSTDKVRGQYAVSIFRPGTGSNNTRILGDTIFDCLPGDVITMSVWGKSTLSGAKMALGILSKASGTPNFFDPSTIYQEQTATLTTSSKKFTMSFVVPADCYVSRLSLLPYTFAATDMTVVLDACESSITTPQAGSGSVTGEIKMWPNAVAPLGYLICNGAIKNISEFEALAAVLQNTYGGVPGTSFGLPDMRGRFPMGAGTFAALNSNEGVAEASRTPSHTHTVAAHNHDMSHTHLDSFALNKDLAAAGSGGASKLTNSTTLTGSVTMRTTNTGNSTAVPTSAQPNTGVNSIPFIGINFIIKT